MDAKLPEQTDPVLVLGAGIAGLGAARSLISRGHRVTVIDAAAEIGGAHRSVVIGPYTFDVGSIFYEEDALLFQIFPGLRDMCPRVQRVERRIAPSGRVRSHPLEPRDIQAWPLWLRLAGFADLWLSRLDDRDDGTAEGACIRRLGRRIYEGSGLRHYISHFSQMPPTAVDAEFYTRRLAFLDKAAKAGRVMPALWKGILSRNPPLFEGAPMRIRPMEGFEALFDPARRMLEAAGVIFELGAPIRRITRDGETFVVTTDRASHRGCAVISAMPLSTCHKAVFDTDCALRSLDVKTIFISATQLPEDFGNVLYNYHPEGRWKRATIYSRLYPGVGAGRAFLAVELTLPTGEVMDPELAYQDFISHLARLGHALDRPKLEGHDLIDAAYPVHLKGELEAPKPYIKALEEFGIVSVGRMGRFEYLRTASNVLQHVDHDLLIPPSPTEQIWQERISA